MKRTLGLTLLLLTLLGSCSKSPKCWFEDKNRGDIVDNFEWPECFEFADALGNPEYIIRSETDVNLILGCESASFPVDFSTYSILMLRAEGQCEIKVIRDLTIDHANKEYVYTVTVKECGFCKKMTSDNQFVLVPAIPDGYTVRFEIDRK